MDQTPDSYNCVVIPGWNIRRPYRKNSQDQISRKVDSYPISRRMTTVERVYISKGSTRPNSFERNCMSASGPNALQEPHGPFLHNILILIRRK